MEGEYVTCHPECVALADALDRHMCALRAVFVAEEAVVVTREHVGCAARRADRVHPSEWVATGLSIEGHGPTDAPDR